MLKPEHKSRLHFYSELASPAVATNRIRRFKSKRSNDKQEIDDNQTALRFLEASKEAAATNTTLEVTSDQPVETISDEAIYQMDMHDIDTTAVNSSMPVIKMSRIRDRAADLATAAMTSRRRFGTIAVTFQRRFSTVASDGKRIVVGFVETASLTVKSKLHETRLPSVNYRRLVWPAGIIAFGILLFFVAYQPYINHRHQAALQSAEWKKDQAQWQCTLRNYQQKTTNKEKSCINE